MGYSDQGNLSLNIWVGEDLSLIFQESLSLFALLNNTAKAVKTSERLWQSHETFIASVVEDLPVLFSASPDFHKPYVNCSWCRVVERLLHSKERGATSFFFFPLFFASPVTLKANSTATSTVLWSVTWSTIPSCSASPAVTWRPGQDKKGIISGEHFPFEQLQYKMKMFVLYILPCQMNSCQTVRKSKNFEI